LSTVRFSVIVPVYEQWGLIPELLRALAAQTLPPRDFEVILVDNATVDFQPPALGPGHVRISHCTTPGSYAARNRGAADARARWLVFTDADCLPQPDWLRHFADLVDQCGSDNQLLAGAVRMTAAKSNPNRYEIYDLVRGIPQHLYVSKGYAATANLAVSDRLFKTLGGFDEQRLSGGDADFCRRAVRAGAHLRFAPAAIVAHPARRSWTALCTKARRVKGGQLRAGQALTRALWLLRSFIPPLHLYLRYLSRRQYPVHYRLVAMLVQTRIWGVELSEAIRLVFLGGEPERR
jgi:GT2 family glycosyltransferase